METRKIVIGGNWKCNGSAALCNSLITLLNDAGTIAANVEVIVAVPSIHLLNVKSQMRKDVILSSQDVAFNTGYGAYTGEISASMLADSKVQCTLTGHSERRNGFGGIDGENSHIVAVKTKNAIDAGLKAIACIGEKLADRESDKTMEVCEEQLNALKSKLSPDDWKNIVIAYEPVWAIGTGKVATPEQAEQTHADVRKWIANNISDEVANSIRIIYGGSVKASNAESLIACPNIDGFLIGGASIIPEFVDIIKIAAGSAY